jgi:CAAX prenyl protease-like protein
MRWLIKQKFELVPLGTYAPRAFWIVAVFFASEHGPYWEVGLVAGIAYNWWMIRTKSLADCMVAHSVTNALLSIYVLVGDHWEYWY